MKYLCAVYLEPNCYQGLSASDKAKLDRASIDYDKELAKRGHYIVSSPLQPPQTAKTVRHRDGKTVVTDGPFAETKEVLGGFILIEARDIDEAVRIAENIPVGKFGSIEVRPEMKIG
ncbi:MAG TPA: YciI family protein [Candidatus Acidoferrum sp.]